MGGGRERLICSEEGSGAPSVVEQSELALGKGGTCQPFSITVYLSITVVTADAAEATLSICRHQWRPG